MQTPSSNTFSNITTGSLPNAVIEKSLANRQCQPKGKFFSALHNIGQNDPKMSSYRFITAYFYFLETACV